MESPGATGKTGQRGLAEVADRVDRAVELRALPAPPLCMTPSFSVDSRADDVEVAALHWNQVVRRLRPDGSGYTALVQMRERLEARGQRVRSQADALDAALEPLLSLPGALSEAEERYGHGTVISWTLTGAAMAPTDGWYWVDLGEGVHVMELDPDVVVDFDEAAYARTRPVRTAGPGTTWGEMAERAWDVVDQVGARAVRAQSESDVYDFRLRIVEQVLREYEVFGYVDEFEPDPSGPQPVPRPDISRFKLDHLLFIVAAHEEVGTANPTEKRNPLLARIDERVMEWTPAVLGVSDKFKWYRGKAKRVAKHPLIEAYREKDDYDNDAGTGDNPSEGERLQEREHFDERIGQLYEKVSAAGMSTVRDVIARWRVRQFELDAGGSETE